MRAFLLEFRPGLEALENSAAELFRHINGDKGPSDSTERPDLFLRSSALRLLELIKDLAARTTVRSPSTITPTEDLAARATMQSSTKTASVEAASTAAPAVLRVASSPCLPSGEAEERVEAPVLGQVETSEGIAGPRDAEIETCAEASGDAGIQLGVQDITQSDGEAGTTEAQHRTWPCVLDSHPSSTETPAWTARSRTDSIAMTPEEPAVERESVPDAGGWPQACSLSDGERPISRERGCAARIGRNASCPRRTTIRRRCCSGSQALTLADRVRKDCPDTLAKPALPRWGRQRPASRSLADVAAPASKKLPVDRRSCRARKCSCTAESRP